MGNLRIDRNMEGVYQALQGFIPPDRVLKNVDMKPYTSFRAGGQSALLVIAETETELVQIVKLVYDAYIAHYFIGNGSNVLVKDQGYEGLIIKLGASFSKVSVEEEVLTAGSSALLSAIAKVAMEHALTGLEFASGIPGSLGGAVAMNAGAYGGEMKDVLIEAKAIDKTGKLLVVPREKLDLGYRHSVFQIEGSMVIQATLGLKKGSAEEIKERMKELNGKRNEKQPVQLPSAGSFFKRPQGYFAGKLIEDARLKGLSVGGAQVSPLHAGFIVNTGGATAQDIIDLMIIVQNTVKDEFGVWLEPEVRIIGKD